MEGKILQWGLGLVLLLYYHVNYIMEKAMAPHSSTLAWIIPWTEEPGRLQSMGSLRVQHDSRLHFHFSLSCIGEGNGNPPQCSCLENPRDGKPGGLPSMGSKWPSSSGSKSLLQHHNLKASILWHSDYFMIQISHLYMTTGKTIVLTIWTFLAKWCPCFLIRCLGLSQLSFQGASIFQFHNCSHNPQWFWSPRK